MGNFVDALLKVRLTIIVNNRWKMDKVGINTCHGIANRWSLTMRDKIDDAAVVQFLENLIDTLDRESREMREISLFNIDKVGEDRS